VRRQTIGIAAAAAVTGLLLAACGNGDSNGTTEETGAGAGNGATEEREDSGDTQPAAVEELTPQVAADVAAMRAATARYANDLDAALDDGFFIITQHMPGMGYHFLNPEWSADGFDPNEPPILMYVEDDGDWRLVGFEWVFPEEPAEAPMDGAHYGDFPAACHYHDGLFVEAAAEEDCDATHAESGAEFTFWHPDLVTLHVWGWLHNPDGLYSPTNPLVG
jgi:hypothetical protein